MQTYLMDGDITVEQADHCMQLNGRRRDMFLRPYRDAYAASLGVSFDTLATRGCFSSTPADLDAAALVPNAKVRIEGLVGRSELNGCFGTALRFAPERARWEVRVDGMADTEIPLGIKADNLDLVSSEGVRGGHLGERF